MHTQCVPPQFPHAHPKVHNAGRPILGPSGQIAHARTQTAIHRLPPIHVTLKNRVMSYELHCKHGMQKCCYEL
jgi:hypothetical protein